jgi:hypothetical protein
MAQAHALRLDTAGFLGNGDDVGPFVNLLTSCLIKLEAHYYSDSLILYHRMKRRINFLHPTKLA